MSRKTHPWVVMNAINVVLAITAATYLQFTDVAWISLPLWYATIWFMFMQGRDYGRNMPREEDESIWEDVYGKGP